MRLHRTPVQRWWPVPLRLLLGLAFIHHGAPKLWSAAGHAGFAGTLQHMGVPAPGFAAWVAAVVEFFGGIALLLGIAVTLASALLVIEMLVAMFLVHWPHGFDAVQVVGQGANGPVFGLPGIEVNLLYIAGLLALFIGGPGPLSFEAWNAGRAQRRGGTGAPAPSRA